MGKIVLATIGSLGDLHPFIAIGKSLADRGEQVLLAVPEDAVAKVCAAGLNAVPIIPSYEEVCTRLGLSVEEATAKVIEDVNFVLEELLVPYLASSTIALDEAAAGADVIAGSIFAFAAEIVAEKRGLPSAAIVLQPMTLFSAWQPPAAPRFELMRHYPRTVIGRAWNRAFLSLGRASLRRRHAGKIDAVRAEHGLSAIRGAPMLDYGVSTKAIVCCWSAVMGRLPPDAPLEAELTGFPLFDSASDAEGMVAPALRTFLDRGSAPLVFTLGSVAVASPGRFYEEASAAIRMLGRRAILLTGQPGPPRLDGDCLFLGYAPHSAILPHAEAVVHHGGIGTTGQALRAGRPQIVVPHYGDQFDNAARLQRAGVGSVIPRKEFERVCATAVISRVLADATMKKMARSAADQIANEDGAAQAAEIISGLV